jgi:hypothetical protein
MALADDLRAAKALIDTPEKWAKGTYQSQSGCLCVLGACRKVVFNGALDGDHPGYVGDANPLAFALGDALPRGRFSVSDYNDDPATTHADIMALFDRAIAAAEAQP